MVRSSARLAALLTALLLISAPNLLFGGPASDIFDLLMPGQTPPTLFILPNPPEGLKAMLAPMISVRTVELRTYPIKEGAGADLLKGFKATLRGAAWDERVMKNPGRGYDAVFSKAGRNDSSEFLLIEMKSREVTFFRVTGDKVSNGDTLQQPVIKKLVPASILALRIMASGPSLQYEPWAQDMIEIRKVQPSGEYTMPDIVKDGTTFLISLPRHITQGLRPMGGLDYAIRGPQRLAVSIESTGSPLTVRLDGARSFNINTANAPVAIVGMFCGGDHRVNVVNQRVVLNLTTVKLGEMKVNATNADIVATLPLDLDALLSINAIAGTVLLKTPDQPAKTDNPFKQTFGQGSALLTLEAISGRITVSLKK
ncbi:MAG: hypothetical protein Q7T82_16845 [Armatimonadota bacterium]|nr:hypothetical protein [Armatimonadota bacterium]